MVFVLAAIMNLIVVGLALFVLKPMRSRIVATEQHKLAHAV
jgi:hypothetical protein